MINPTDTNQASEVRKALKTAILSLRHAEIATRPSSIEDANRAFESAVQHISDFIRTEKQKLLAEVREEAFSGGLSFELDDGRIVIEVETDLKSITTKLEAEL